MEVLLGVLDGIYECVIYNFLMWSFYLGMFKGVVILKLSILLINFFSYVVFRKFEIWIENYIIRVYDFNYLFWIFKCWN